MIKKRNIWMYEIYEFYVLRFCPEYVYLARFAGNSL